MLCTNSELSFSRRFIEDLLNSFGAIASFFQGHQPFVCIKTALFFPFVFFSKSKKKKGQLVLKKWHEENYDATS
jgi:hypothetical protein